MAGVTWGASAWERTPGLAGAHLFGEEGLLLSDLLLARNESSGSPMWSRVAPITVELAQPGAA